MKIKVILVPIDFSSTSLDALESAVDFAKSFKAGLTVLFVIEPIYYAVPDFVGAPAAMGSLIEEQIRTGREQLLALQRRYAKRRVKLRTLMRTGTPYQEIVNTAKSLKADLVVMATHGRTGVTHLLLGSVAERVVRSAHCPVLTLRGGKVPRRRSSVGKSKKRN